MNHLKEKPLLKIGPISVLQDARYSAAVGFDIITYCLARGDMRKVSAATAWNLVQWLSGPVSALELNAESWEEIAEATALFPVKWIEFPWEDRRTAWGTDANALAVAATLPDAESLAAWFGENERHYLQLTVQHDTPVEAFSNWLNRVFFRFDSPETATHWLSANKPLPLGIAFSTEWEESPGEMDYPALDDVLELLESRVMG